MHLNGFPIGVLHRHDRTPPQCHISKRCFYRLLKTETRQILLTIKGEILSEINLVTFSTYKTSNYTPEPLRCYKCQRIGHHKEKCKATPRCAICASNHINISLAKLKEGNTFEAICPNCNLKHHTWNFKCPQRVVRLPKNTEKTEVTTRNATTSKQVMSSTSSTTDWAALQSRHSSTAPAEPSTASNQHHMLIKSSPHWKR